MPYINHEKRACDAWPVLINAAKSGGRITYGELADKIGIHHRAVKWVLSLIQDYCLNDRLPPLTIIVINQTSDAPGHGFIAWDVKNLEEGKRLVHQFNWSQLSNPFEYAATDTSIEDLATELVQKPENSKEVYARVKVRGIAQQIFWKALLIAYESKCAICSLSFVDALEAAHLIEWQAASTTQKMAVTNGLLLCSTHHRLFDAGCITVSPSFRITYFDPNSEHGPYSDADVAATIALHGKPIALPARQDLHPSQTSLAHAHKRHDWKEPW